MHTGECFAAGMANPAATCAAAGGTTVRSFTELNTDMNCAGHEDYFFKKSPTSCEGACLTYSGGSSSACSVDCCQFACDAHAGCDYYWSAGNSECRLFSGSCDSPTTSSSSLAKVFEASPISIDKEEAMIQARLSKITHDLPAPVVFFDFEGSTPLEDSVSSVPLTLAGGASLNQGQLDLTNGGYAISDNIAPALSAGNGHMTLMSWVQLSDVSETGGGSAISVQNGATFDGIVYGEITAGQWMAGSNSFRRTVVNNNGGAIEGGPTTTYINDGGGVCGTNAQHNANRASSAGGAYFPNPVTYEECEAKCDASDTCNCFSVRSDDRGNCFLYQTCNPGVGAHEASGYKCYSPVTASNGAWLDDHKCPRGNFGGTSGTAFNGDTSFSTDDEAMEACAAACRADDECKFADLFGGRSYATCYMKTASCGDYVGNTHGSYKLFSKDGAIAGDGMDWVPVPVEEGYEKQLWMPGYECVEYEGSAITGTLAECKAHCASYQYLDFKARDGLSGDAHYCICSNECTLTEYAEYDIYATDTSAGFVHLVWTYGWGGICMYRNGEQYGSCYDVTEDQLVRYGANSNTQVVFGARHMNAGATSGYGSLTGKIESAAVFAVALSPAQVLRLYQQESLSKAVCKKSHPLIPAPSPPSPPPSPPSPPPPCPPPPLPPSPPPPSPSPPPPCPSPPPPSPSPPPPAWSSPAPSVNLECAPLSAPEFGNGRANSFCGASVLNGVPGEATFSSNAEDGAIFRCVYGGAYKASPENSWIRVTDGLYAGGPLDGQDSNYGTFCLNGIEGYTMNAAQRGYCSTGFYSNDRPSEIDSVEACARVCRADGRCKAFSFDDQDHDCNRYDSDCTTITSSANYFSYIKDPFPYETPTPDGWCSHPGAVHQDTPTCGRVCHDNAARGVAAAGTWGSDVACSACPEADWPGCELSAGGMAHRVCAAPSTSTSDGGFPDDYRGWYSVDGSGCCNDYCRWVGNSGSGGDPSARVTYGSSYWSCRPAGTSDTYDIWSGSQVWTGSTFDYTKCDDQGVVLTFSGYIQKTSKTETCDNAIPTAAECLSAVHSFNPSNTLHNNAGHNYGNSWPTGCFMRYDGTYFFNTGGVSGTPAQDGRRICIGSEKQLWKSGYECVEYQGSAITGTLDECKAHCASYQYLDFKARDGLSGDAHYCICSNECTLTEYAEYDIYATGLWKSGYECLEYEGSAITGTLDECKAHCASYQYVDFKARDGLSGDAHYCICSNECTLTEYAEYDIYATGTTTAWRRFL